MYFCIGFAVLGSRNKAISNRSMGFYIIEMDIAFGPDNHLNTFLIVWKCFFILLPGQFANKQYLVYARNPFFKRLNRHSKPNTNSFCKKLRNV